MPLIQHVFIEEDEQESKSFSRNKTWEHLIIFNMPVTKFNYIPSLLL